MVIYSAIGLQAHVFLERLKGPEKKKNNNYVTSGRLTALVSSRFLGRTIVHRPNHFGLSLSSWEGGHWISRSAGALR